MRSILRCAPTWIVLLIAVAGGIVACGKSNPAAPQASGPDMPSGVMATAQPGQVVLVWDPVAAATSYVVYWDSVGSVDALDAELTTNRPGLTHGGLRDGATYYYRVAAVNSGGSSNLTPQVSATPSKAAAFKSIVCGGDNSFAVMSNGLVYAWGRNGSGQLGLGNFSAQHQPAQVPVISNVTQLDAGPEHTIALTVSGRAFTWGRNDGGQLGTGDNQLMWNAASVNGPLDFISVAAGKDHSMGVTRAGQVWIWGINFSGILGLGHEGRQWLPAAVPGLVANGGFVAAGERTSFYKSANVSGVSTALYSWGSNGSGQLGRPDPGPPFQYGGVSGASTISAFSTMFQHAVAIRDGFAIAWGRNDFGQVGVAGNTPVLSPAGVSLTERVVAVAAGLTQSLALSEAGTVYLWGEGDWHPRPVAGLGQVVMIAAGRAHNLALTLDGTLWAWGNNTWGQLGDGTTISHDQPVKVLGF